MYPVFAAQFDMIFLDSNKVILAKEEEAWE